MASGLGLMRGILIFSFSASYSFLAMKHFLFIPITLCFLLSAYTLIVNQGVSP